MYKHPLVGELEKFMEGHRIGARSTKECTHQFGCTKYALSREAEDEMYSLSIFDAIVDSKFDCIVYNLSEWNCPLEGYLRYVIDIDDEENTPDCVRKFIATLYKEVCLLQNVEDIELEVIVLRKNPPPSKAHVHVTNLVSPKHVFLYLNNKLRTAYPEGGIDVYAGSSLFLVYGSGKQFKKSIRTVPYTYYDESFIATCEDPRKWTNTTYPAKELPRLLSLRRPFKENDIMVYGLDSTGVDKKLMKNVTQLISNKKNHSGILLSRNQKQFVNTLINSWAEMSVEYHTWHRVLCAIVNTIHPCDEKLCKSLCHSFSSRCPEKYDASEVDRVINNILDFSEEHDKLLYISGINPLNERELELEKKVMYEPTATYGKHNYINAFVQEFFRDIILVRVNNPVSPSLKMVLRYDEQSGIYMKMEDLETSERYYSVVQPRVLDFMTKLCCKYLMNIQNFEMLYEYELWFQDKRKDVCEEMYKNLLANSKFIDDVEFEKRRKYMVFRNGLLNLDTCEFGPYSPDVYCMAKNDNIYDCRSPTVRNNIARVHKILGQIFGEDEDTLNAFYAWCQKCLVSGGT